MSKPTQDDANIMLQLLRWGAAEKVQEAMNWIWSDSFIEDYDEFVKKYPPAVMNMEKPQRFADGLNQLERSINKGC